MSEPDPVNPTLATNGTPVTVPPEHAPVANNSADDGATAGPAVAGLPLARVGRYPVFGELGRGGMGAVLLSRDPDLGLLHEPLHDLGVVLVLFEQDLDGRLAAMHGVRETSRHASRRRRTAGCRVASPLGNYLGRDCAERARRDSEPARAPPNPFQARGPVLWKRSPLRHLVVTLRTRFAIRLVGAHQKEGEPGACPGSSPSSRGRGGRSRTNVHRCGS
jgi:hypothetical protein